VEIKDAFNDIRIPGMTVTEVKEFGRQQGHIKIYPGAEFDIAFVPKMEIEAVVPEDMVE
jgi:nitrogen regulatory protein PII